MTYIVSNRALNSTHSLTHSRKLPNLQQRKRKCKKVLVEPEQEHKAYTTFKRWHVQHHTNLLNEVDCWLKIKAEVNELPVDALAAILILLKDEHCVVEQLLKLLICVVDAQLFEGIELQHVQLQRPT